MTVAPQAGPAISTRGLGKSFGERVAFTDLTLDIAPGEVFGFLGPNGAGKTTTVRTLSTLLTPSTGSATVAGLPLVPENGIEIRRRISVMPETPGLYLKLSVRENLECFTDLHELDEARARVDRALDAVNLRARADDPCGTLSKGLRQRVALARAILPDPTILFLDEPTAGLDPVAIREVHELIGGLRGRGVTIFLTTHRLEEAEKLCDRVAILATSLRTIGRPSELRERLFARSLTVRTLAPLASPAVVFDGLPGVEAWRADGTAVYDLEISRCLRGGSGGDARPRCRGCRRPLDRRVPALPRGRLSRAHRRRCRGGSAMTLRWRPIRGVIRKELREYRRTRQLLVAMTIFPLIFLIQPLYAVLVARDSRGRRSRVSISSSICSPSPSWRPRSSPRRPSPASAAKAASSRS